jgi:hypothetical protein
MFYPVILLLNIFYYNDNNITCIQHDTVYDDVCYAGLTRFSAMAVIGRMFCFTITASLSSVWK